MITIRPFNTQDFSDYEMLSAIDKAIYPLHFDSAEALQRGTKQFKNRFLRRFLAQKDGKTIGYGTVFETFWWDEPDQYAIMGAVLPHLQGRGYGKALFEKALTAVTSQTPKSFVIWTREDKPRAIHFAKARGYKLIQRDAASILRINGFDEAAFAAATQKMTQNSLTIRSAVALEKSDPQWKLKLYELAWLLYQDIPSSEKPKKQPFEEWCTHHLDDPDQLMDSLFVAITPANEFVGYTALRLQNKNAGVLQVQMTGVTRAWRRKGIAWALKLYASRYAIQNGYQSIVTENEENNPMYDLNIKLGFKPLPAWVTYKKRIAE